MNRTEYIREYQREWIANRRATWLNEHGPCAECGSFNELEIDHINPADKTMNVSAVWGMSLDNPVRIAELAKYQVLCNPCHTIKTALQLMPDHGTITRYENHKCRCIPCKAAKAIKNAKRYRPISLTAKAPVL